MPIDDFLLMVFTDEVGVDEALPHDVPIKPDSILDGDGEMGQDRKGHLRPTHTP